MRTHGGYAGVSDDELLRIPYARVLQAIRIAGEHASEAARERVRHAAFIGWQVRSAVAGSLGGSTPSFGQYLKQLGLDSDPVVAAPRERASANAERVRAAFAAGRMRKL